MDTKLLKIKRGAENRLRWITALREQENKGGVRMEEVLTFSLGDRGGGGDGTEGGAAWIGRVGPSQSHRVAHPRCRVNGSDRLIYTNRSREKKLQTVTVALKMQTRFPVSASI